jgi:hypothetical protein
VRLESVPTRFCPFCVTSLPSTFSLVRLRRPLIYSSMPCHCCDQHLTPSSDFYAVFLWSSSRFCSSSSSFFPSWTTGIQPALRLALPREPLLVIRVGTDGICQTNSIQSMDTSLAVHVATLGLFIAVAVPLDDPRMLPSRSPTVGPMIRSFPAFLAPTVTETPALLRTFGARHHIGRLLLLRVGPQFFTCISTLF